MKSKILLTALLIKVQEIVDEYIIKYKNAPSNDLIEELKTKLTSEEAQTLHEGLGIVENAKEFSDEIRMIGIAGILKFRQSIEA